MNESEQDKLDDVISLVQTGGRVCPKPGCWDELWNMLPGIKRAGIVGDPLPYPNVAWWNTPVEQKRELLIIYLKYAAQNGILEEVEEFLKSLNEDQWTHEGEID
ncbi:MAG: hypothetical protein ACUZ8I_16975 [Candidatus Scalindua sp.]